MDGPTPTSTSPYDAAKSDPKLSNREFDQIRKLVYDRFGIALGDQKRSLVISRLRSLLRKHDFSTFQQYYEHVVHEPSGEAIDELANRITTNFTYFYREEAHFDFYTRTVLPDITARLSGINKRDLRIWCAACSTGEEAYMLAILLHDFLGPQYGSWTAGLLATDISLKALETARTAVYDEEELSRIPANLKYKYFTKLEDGRWAVTPEVKKEVTYRRFNLMNTRMPFRRPFHVIFCRNVMIYFDQPTKRALVQRLYDITEPGGYLFIAHSETLERGATQYRSVAPSVYKKD